jgi:hypothetical protein
MTGFHVDGYATPPASDDGNPQPMLGAIPTYPTEALPETVRELVRYGERSGLAAALVGGAALGAISAAIGAGSTLEITPSWPERPILWLPLLAPRGAGKSPAQDLAFWPLRRHDAELEGDDGRVLLGDTTVEALARDLHAADGAATLELDELAVLLRGMGEYKGGASGDRGRFLSLWTGAPWSYRRVGSSGKAANAIRLNISTPTLVICGGLQPALHDLLGGEEDGLRPRWLPHLAAMPERTGKLIETRVPADWQTLVGGCLLPIRGDVRAWKFGHDALGYFEEYRRQWKAQAREHETASTSAALVKADKQLGRVTLTLAEASDPGKGGTVDAEHVHRAAQIVNFAMGCWRALPEQGGFALSRADETLDRAIPRLISWLEEHGGKASKREIQRACVAGVRTTGDLGKLLTRYEARYPGSLTTARPVHGGLPITIVSAPARRRSPSVSASADTEGGAPENPHEHWGSDGVGTADTESADIESADTAPEPPTAPERRSSTKVSPNGDTKEGAPENPVNTGDLRCRHVATPILATPLPSSPPTPAAGVNGAVEDDEFTAELLRRKGGKGGK